MLDVNNLIGFGAGGDSYRVNALDFDNGGAGNQYLHRGAGLTGAVDGGKGTFAAWINFTDAGYNGVTQNIMVGTNATKFGIQKLSNNKLNVSLQDASGSNQFEVRGASTFTATTGWLALMCSWDMSFTAGSRLFDMYIGDSNEFGTLNNDIGTSFVVDYTQADWYIGGAAQFGGFGGAFFLDTTQRLDFSVQANRRKFFDSVGKPVFAGADGSVPTGVQPLIFINNKSATAGVNAGTGGDFVVVGTLNDAASSPSD